MQLISHCQICRKELVLPLPFEVSEAEADRIARLIRCADCWLGADKTPANQTDATRGDHGAMAGQQGGEFRYSYA